MGDNFPQSQIKLLSIVNYDKKDEEKQRMPIALCRKRYGY